MSGDQTNRILPKIINDYDRRIETIQTIGNSRTLWSKKLDQLFDIVDNLPQPLKPRGVELDSAAEAQGKQAPMFEVDPFWPKPLPNHWILGSTIGIGVDSRDHIYIIHRRDTFNERTEIGAATDPVKADCCIPAPNVLEFDPDGNLVNHWGGPGEGYTWPASNHGITIDHKDNIWIGGNGRTDSHILKFTRDGGSIQYRLDHQGELRGCDVLGACLGDGL